MTATLTPNAKQQFFDANGNPLAGGKLYTYIAGTTSPATTYVDSAGVTTNTNPIILDSRGEANVWLGTGTFKFKLLSATDVEIWTVDNIPGAPASNAALAALAASDGSSLVGFIQSGTGAVATTVQTKLRESVSVKDFGAKGDGTTSDATAFYNACIYCWQTGANLYIPPGNYLHGRVELHGSFNVIGSGATVEYLGVGTTYIAGTGTGTSAAPTAWPNDPAYDPSGYFTPVMYTLAATISKGATSFTVTSASGLVAGQYLFIGGNPTSASSVGNYIPTDFEFVRISSVVGTTINISGAFKNSYTTIGTGAGAAAAFYSAGLAVNCKVSGLKISTSIDAYQYVVRSALNVTLEQLEFIGLSATGASTFAENLKIDQWKVHYANGPISTARGTVSTSISNVEYLEGTGGPTGLFIEESLYRLDVRNFNGRNSGLSIRSLAMGTPATKRLITLHGCVFDATAAADSPFQCGTASGVDLVATGCTFVGTVVTPNSSTYPGITGTCMTWVTSIQTNDVWKFNSCYFSSAGIGSAYKSGSGVIGSILFDDLCTFNTVTLDSIYYRGGVWTTFPVSAPATNSDANTAYSKRDTTVRLRSGVTLNATAVGGTIGTLPVGYRPPVGQYFPVTCVGTGGAYFTVGEINISTSGVVVWQGAERTAIAVQLDSISFSTV